MDENRVKPYKMLQFMKTANFDFLSYGKKACFVSLAVIVVSLAIFFGRAFKNAPQVLAVDFTGGASMTYSYDKKADIADVRKIVEGVVNDASIQYQSSPDGTGNMLLIKTGTMKIGDLNSSKVIEDALVKGAPDSKFKLSGEEDVGSEIGADLKRSAFWAILVSLIGILAYVGIRFEFGFALGGVVALGHDALITLGLYSLCGRQVSLTIVAALLTIVGYSINDTIVVFDRIREIMVKLRKRPLVEIMNKAVNETLSRTVMTSFTTILVLVALFFLGGEIIHDFAFALLIGIGVGTYSSIFVAAPVVLAMEGKRQPKLPGSEGDDAAEGQAAAS